MSSIPRPFALLATLLIAAPAIAQDTKPAPVIDPAKLDGDSLTIGIGAGAVPSYEGSDDMVFSPVPGVIGRVSRINFTLRGNRFWADLIPTKGGPGWDFELGPVVSVNFNRSSSIKDPRVRALGKLRAAIEAGGYIGIGKQGLITSDYDKLSVSVAYTRDVNHVYRSYLITPAIDYGTPLSTKAYVGLSLAADYMGGGYAQTYFGVTPAGSAASGLPAFSAGKGWKDYSITGIGDVSLTGDLTHGLSLVGAVSYRRLLNDAADTPVTRIAGSPSQWTAVLGLAYTF
ncbi:MAG: MipA/OmpV family protein [Sphingomonas sp.]